MLPATGHAPCNGACSLQRGMLPATGHAPCNGACSLQRGMLPATGHAPCPAHRAHRSCISYHLSPAVQRRCPRVLYPIANALLTHMSDIDRLGLSPDQAAVVPEPFLAAFDQAFHEKVSELTALFDTVHNSMITSSTFIIGLTSPRGFKLRSLG